MSSISELPESLATSQDKILYQIKRAGPLSAKDLASLIGVTTMAVRQHLKNLEELNLVISIPEESSGRGRPVRCWKLTDKGHGRFPDSHAVITSELIVSIKDVLGDHAIDRIIDKRTEDTLGNYKKALEDAAGLPEKLDRLSELRTKEGYMAEVEQSGKAYLFKEHHCPICIAAKACHGFCRSELEVFQQLFADSAKITREDHILNGARRCTYRIEPL